MTPIVRTELQGSAEWLALRNIMISATNIAPIMGISPFKTALMLYEEKLGLREPEKLNSKMEEGMLLEDQARNYFNKKYNSDFKPIVLQHGKIEYLMASLDGLNSKGEILEIKCGQGSHNLAKQGIVPDYYFSQIQCQMFCSNAKEAQYFSYRSDEDNILIIVNRDEDFIEKMLVACKVFFVQMMEFDPPPPTDKDYAVSDDKDLIFKLKVLSSLKKQLKDITLQISDLEDTIIEECKSVSTKAENFKITKCTRRGNVDYSRIEILKSVNLDDYRKPSTQYFRISET